MPGESFVSWTQTPITTPGDIRKMTGLVQEGDIPSADLTADIVQAQVIVTSELSERVHDVALWGSLDGVNTRFELPPRFTGRVLFDVLNTGQEKDGVQVYLRRVGSGTSPRTFDLATVASVDALHGQVVLSAAPAPATYDSVRFTGLLVRSAVTKGLFKTCVELYAAHLAIQRFKGPGRVVPSNPQAQRGDERVVRANFFNLYEREVRNLRNPGRKAAAVKTSMPFMPEGDPVTW